MKRPLAASLLTAALLALSPAAPAAATESGEVGTTSCAVSVTWERSSYPAFDGLHLGHKVKVHWNPCGRTVRARAHCNGFPFGTYYTYGNKVSSTGVTSTYCGGDDPRYGSQGYQDYHGGRWHYHHLF